jgi:hypothetical protein
MVSISLPNREPRVGVSFVRASVHDGPLPLERKPILDGGFVRLGARELSAMSGERHDSPRYLEDTSNHDVRMDEDQQDLEFLERSRNVSHLDPVARIVVSVI